MQRLLFAKIELWAVLILLFLFSLGVIVFGAAVLDGEREGNRFGPVSNVALTVAEIPDTVKTLIKGDHAMMAFQADRFGDKPAGWTFAPGPRPEGYILLSRYDGDAKRHVVEMVSLADGAVKHSWKPDAEALLADAPRDSKIAEYTNWTNEHYRVIHPYLTENGELIIKDHQSYLFALGSCSEKLWGRTEELLHHSTESDGEGGFWIPGYYEPSEIRRVSADFIDDALVHLGPDGSVIHKQSATRIFLRHRMEYLIFTAGDYQKDPLHLNDIQPVLKDGPYWKKGDLFLSFRHQSMVMLYRPSTDEIVWMQQGPWLAQHDVDILDDTRIAIFNNKAYDRGTGARVHNTNQITVYDFATGEISVPWARAMEQPDVKTLFEGLFRVMPGNLLMAEEENSGRLLILSPDGGTIGEFINKAADGMAYRMGWSRYMTQAEGDAALAQLSGDCPS